MNNGIQIQALLPKRVVPDDRIKIIDWFHVYRTQVAAQHPTWVTMFHSTDYTYALDIFPTDTPRQFVAKGLEELSATPSQLEFDFYGG
jgi:hypothetical protein